ncbi:SCO family protein [Phycisphaera mikurensis]|uniref:SCO1 protein homolog n=1 Tax=Phycisphaera mikurensis (strain NBRC 102666 / KCTC 22515 / FYK2301M01) TaxID=1142394 RepID=I0IHU7_PHYMF|nr:SCO family protein [Phycisphaera mikurensis]MBB6441077.1 protein SCO1/2 [Phycisphaera mikurensis]BAM04835.1 SCO1 protein homolog [Phycisphaera mikurensis NBRC 102666]
MIGRRLLQGTGLACLLAAGGLLVMGRPGARPTPPAGFGEAAEGELPDFGPAPPFKLTDQAGEPFDSASLRGEVWVADFVFTRCVLVCPVLSRVMARLQEATVQAGVADGTRLVSLSVDPEHDTPAVLAAYADRHGADPTRWHFLTGERDEVWSVVRDGFKLLVSPTPEDAVNPIAHTPRLVLVDRTGSIRGLYDGTVPEDVEALERDLLRLASG